MAKDKRPELSFENKRARFDYVISDNYEAGIELNGFEIKAIRAKRVNLSHSYGKIVSGEAFWLGGNIEVKEGDNQRTRKLLMKRSEIDKIFGKLSQDKMNLIPLKMYIKRGKAKLLLGLGKSKKKQDKRATLKARDLTRENERYVKLK